MHDSYTGEERRRFLRCGYRKPFHYSLVSSPEKETPISSFIKAVSRNLSASGILFITKAEGVPKVSSLIMLDLDYSTASTCKEIEGRALIKNNKLLGKVTRIEDNEDGTYGVGVAFITKSKRLNKDIKNLT